MPNRSTIILLSLILLVAVNMLFLDIIVFSRLATQEVTSAVSDNVFPTPTSVDTTQACPISCQTLLAKGIANITPFPAAVVSQVPVQIVVKAKEYYIPLGTGTTKSSDYEELSGAEAYINTESYPNIKQVTFEVFLRNPTGNGRVYAKLYNVTDKHDVWLSEVFFEGGGLGKKEATISLDSGNKLYRVMMKSTMKYDVYADTARVKIVTN